MLEPLFYLLSVKVGLGALVGPVTGPGGRPVGYTEFVAPALLATSSMNGAVYDSTFNVFHKLKYAKVYDAALATPLGPGDIALGEITWALSRGLLYAIMFLAVLAALGLVHSAWLLLAIPASVLIGFAFAGLGMAATTYMRSWKDFDFVILATLPMFLFSSTFYPLSVYPRALQIVVECTPLYQAVALLRGFALGDVRPGHARQRRLPGRPRPGRALRGQPPDPPPAAEVAAAGLQLLGTPADGSTPGKRPASRPHRNAGSPGRAGPRTAAAPRGDGRVPERGPAGPRGHRPDRRRNRGRLTRLGRLGRLAAGRTAPPRASAASTITATPYCTAVASRSPSCTSRNPAITAGRPMAR